MPGGDPASVIIFAGQAGASLPGGVSDASDVEGRAGLWQPVPALRVAFGAKPGHG